MLCAVIRQKCVNLIGEGESREQPHVFGTHEARLPAPPPRRIYLGYGPAVYGKSARTSNDTGCIGETAGGGERKEEYMPPPVKDICLPPRAPPPISLKDTYFVKDKIIRIDLPL